MHYRESALFQGLQRSLRQRERLKFFISNESSLVLPFRKVYFHVMLTFLFEIEKARCNYTTFFRYRETFTYYVLFRTTLSFQSFVAECKWQRSGQKQQTKVHDKIFFHFVLFFLMQFLQPTIPKLERKSRTLTSLRFHCFIFPFIYISSHCCAEIAEKFREHRRNRCWWNRTKR